MSAGAVSVGKCTPATSVSVPRTSCVPGRHAQQRGVVADAEHARRARRRGAARGCVRSGRIRRTRVVVPARPCASASPRAISLRAPFGGGAVEHAVDVGVAVLGAEALGGLDRLVDHDAVRHVEAMRAVRRPAMRSTARSIGSTCSIVAVEEFGAAPRRVRRVLDARHAPGPRNTRGRRSPCPARARTARSPAAHRRAGQLPGVQRLQRAAARARTRGGIDAVVRRCRLLCASGFMRSCSQQLRHLERGQRRLLALVAVRCRRRALRRLRASRPPARRWRPAARCSSETCIRPSRAFVGDVFVMAGVAAHHAAERDERGMLAGRAPARCAATGISQRAGHADHVDRVLGARRCASKACARAVDQRIGDARVPAAGEDREACAGGGAQVAFEWACAGVRRWAGFRPAGGAGSAARAARRTRRLPGRSRPAPTCLRGVPSTRSCARPRSARICAPAPLRRHSASCGAARGSPAARAMRASSVVRRAAPRPAPRPRRGLRAAIARQRLADRRGRNRRAASAARRTADSCTCTRTSVGVAASGVAAHQREMQLAAEAVAIGVQAERAVLGVDRRARRRARRCARWRGDSGSGPRSSRCFRPCSRANSSSCRPPRHAAVGVEDLDQHAGRLQAGEQRQVAGRLGVAGARRARRRAAPSAGRCGRAATGRSGCASGRTAVRMVCARS